MILFGTCVGYPEKLREYAAPGVAYSMLGEAYSYLAIRSDGRDLFPVYRRILRAAIFETWDVDALVLLHDDLELKDRHFASKVAHIFQQDSDVAIIGCIGAKNVRSLNWWEGDGRGYCVDGRDGRTVVDFGFPEGDPGEVDSVDGMLLILSPWAITHLTLPEDMTGFHGYSEELCFQARSKGKRVVVTQFDLFHHTKGGIVGPSEGWDAAGRRFQERWMSG